MAEGEQQKTPVVAEAHNVDTFHPPQKMLDKHPSKPHIANLEEYQKLYKESITDPTNGSFEGGDTAWFVEGTLNACYNLADEPDGGRKVTYQQLLRDGDTVAIYLPMIPEALVAILACIRLGAVHSSRVVITSDEGKRGGKLIGTKKIRTGADVPFTEGRDWWWHDEVEKWPTYFPPPKGVMHTTAGYLLGAACTGKYVFDIHDGDRYFCGGDVGWITGHTYGTPAYPNFSRYWDIIAKHERAGDEHVKADMKHLRVLGSVGEPIAAEIWKWYFETTETGSNVITPLAGVTPTKPGSASLPFFGIEPAIIDPVSGDEIHGNDVEGVLAFKQPWPSMARTVYGAVGKEEAHVVDTYWQTETGSNVITPLAGVTPTKPGSASLPFFGIEPAIIDPVSGDEIHGNDVEGVLAFKQPWPSMARTVYGAHKRYMDTYLNVYKGYYFTGDGAGRDHEGFYWIRGRVDDVVNVSGHRLSTAEIEAALLEHHSIAEAAVVGVADELTGQAVNAFVALKDATGAGDALRKEFIMQVRKSIGPFAAPKAVFIVPDLPKTRSGKIMRRILRKILAGEEDQLGDITTLSDPSIVEKIINLVHEAKGKK
ncbi:Acetyl-coenzyme A synthetase 1 like protein [Verticillium longisporum]|uniref:Acetyl-coenzyme A synthetase 1 like protein n=1 Tax=Verticillium longisporum TaxID=100787 RepID=A0A8I2ZNJ1_VERLO|nr:Acetyl-coenzyme A synthetase 1 like protein [Verticillium longisporum]